MTWGLTYFDQVNYCINELEALDTVLQFFKFLHKIYLKLKFLRA